MVHARTHPSGSRAIPRGWSSPTTTGSHPVKVSRLLLQIIPALQVSQEEGGGREEVTLPPVSPNSRETDL